MVTDRQVRKLFRLLSLGETLASSALKTGISERTARRYRKMGKLPSESRLDGEREWRTRQDPFEAVWPQVLEQLEA